MKMLCLFLMISTLCLHRTIAKIRNGYDIQLARTSLENLNMLKFEDLTFVKRQRIKEKIKSLHDYVAYAILTDSLLNQFKIISPELYDQIDTLKDQRGRPVTVYIKFIPYHQESTVRPGTTYMAQQGDDNDGCYSNFGPQSVAVVIWIVDISLNVLAHELGHVRYQVPNIDSYMKYYKMNYVGTSNQGYLGHHPSDPSGKFSEIFASTFQNCSRNYLENREINSPFFILHEIRKKLMKG